MRAVIQRVCLARVLVDARVAGEIREGLVALVAFEKGDDEGVVARTADKLARLRIFGDRAGKMNLSLLDTGFSALLVPNFTVAGSTCKGHRPSFDPALEPEKASALFARLVATMEEIGVRTESGVFGAHMSVELVNDGPVTVMLEI